MKVQNFGKIIFVSVFLSNANTVRADEKLEIMVVSASKAQIPIEQSTLSLSRVDAETLKDVGASHPQEIGAQVPGAWISRGNGQEHLTAIRSPVLTGAGSCGAFLVAEDSIPVRASGSCNANQLFDSFYEVAEAVEVFRGPNSAVFGSNALFGGINILTPSLNENTKSRLEFEIGSDDYYRTKYTLANQQKTALAFGSITDADSFRENANFAQQKLGFKLKQSAAQWDIVSTLLINNLEQETAGFIEGEDAYKDDELRESNLNPEAYRDAQSLRGWVELSRELGAGTINLKPYARYNRMEFLMHFVPWQPTEENGQRSIGLQAYWLNSGNESFIYSAGIDIDRSSTYLREYQNSPAPFAQANFPQGAHYDYDVSILQASPYLSTHFHVNERIKLNAQLRWDSITYDYTNNIAAGSACDDSASACRFFRPESREDSYSLLSWQIGAMSELNSSMRLFANVGRGFRAPQTAELYRAQSDNFDALNNVTMNSVELGLRGELGNFQYQIIGFDMQQEDGIYQNSEREYLIGANTSHNGIEYELNWDLNSQFSLALLGTHASHRYDNAPQTLGVSVDVEGNRIDTAPDNIYTAKTRWSYSDAGHVYLQYSILGEYFLDPENDYRYEGHGLWDASLSHEFSRSWSLKLKLKNLMNVKYADRADIAFGEYRYFPGARRSFYLSVERIF